MGNFRAYRAPLLFLATNCLHLHAPVSEAAQLSVDVGGKFQRYVRTIRYELHQPSLLTELPE